MSKFVAIQVGFYNRLYDVMEAPIEDPNMDQLYREFVADMRISSNSWDQDETIEAASRKLGLDAGFWGASLEKVFATWLERRRGFSYVDWESFHIGED